MPVWGTAISTTVIFPEQEKIGKACAVMRLVVLAMLTRHRDERQHTIAVIQTEDGCSELKISLKSREEGR